MIIPVQIYNYFKAHIVSNKVHKKSGVMDSSIAIRLLDISGVEKFYNGNNPMNENESLLDHYTNAWLHISPRDVLEILDSRIGINYPSSRSRVITRSIGPGDIMMTGAVIPINNNNIDYMTMIDLVFRRSIALLGYYIEDENLDWITIKEIDIASYEDWCYILNYDISGIDVFGW